MEKKKLLSISLLVSNRPDTVEKCLKSLDHLRQNVPSELILVDTGCGEKVRKIIEPYADKIVNFKWCGDFAKARNAGLKEATGEWFLYLDDDEWFEDTLEIEQFFLSDEWKEYGYAMYKVRNYLDFSGKNYDDALVTRMAALNENVKFIYSIHETFDNLRGMVKRFHSYVHHYGYVYKSPKEFFMHSQRNVIPLLEEHRKNPEQLRHNVQLAQEYNGIHEYRKSIEISLEGIKQKHRNENLRYVNALFVNVVKCYFTLYDYKTAQDYGGKYLRDTRINELGEAAICSILCKVSYEIGNYQECLNYEEKYYNAYKKQLEDENYFLYYNGIFLNCFEKKELSFNVGFGIRAALSLNDFRKAKELFDRIDYTEKTLFVDRDAIDKIVEKYIQKNEEGYFYMVKTMMENASLVAIIIDLIEQRRKKESQVFEGTSIKWKRLESYHWYFKYLAFWSFPSTKRIEDYQKIWDEPEYALPKSIEYGIWNMVENCHFNIATVISNIPFYKWEKAVEHVCQMSPWTELCELNEKIRQLDMQEIHSVWWSICYDKRSFKEMDGTKELAEEEMHELRNAMMEYATECLKFFRHIYKDDLFKERALLLPEHCQASFLLEDLLRKEEQMSYPDMVEILKNLRNISSDFDIPVKYYLEYVNKRIKMQEAEQQMAKEELILMAKKILPKIEELIQMNKESEALGIVQQVRKLIPDDKEMEELEIRLRTQNANKYKEN